ncbi:MAG: hypothetical protein PVH63_05780 [Balneolaceae bacterium]|jgi:hypothetical protein
MEELVILILIAFGTVLGCLLLWKIYHVIKSSIQKDNLSIGEEDFDRLARAFIQHKKEMQKRVQNLEAIIANKENGKDFIQIEETDRNSKLSNDLKNKDKVRS